ncbi:H4MPT-linked C1 transfer pathway protein [Dethiosulfatarculus sandiegensis]|uniref:H4MPT-linked C1 transfer pathway protein n=1 Tax=Dethiosulfatarculus sandiegensis TaxID=1429043 RepID=A0A0D2GB88_9BACT|nr:H4MPT-linked C1 transfer pathway protein [Dethiosulfatarculus sandiegensis]
MMGWDIGGVNTKACRVPQTGEEDKATSLSKGFEIWRNPEKLPELLGEMARELGPVRAMAVTMTAELSDAFQTKSQGVGFILEALARAFGETEIWVLGTHGRFVELSKALLSPLDFAANNWVASCLYEAKKNPDCFVLDMGSTTTDIIPIRQGRLLNKGTDDTSRLAQGELVYTGALRSNPNTLVRQVPFDGRMVRVADELFCLMADVHLLAGKLEPEEYTCPTADGRGRSPEECHARLARLVCADRDIMSFDQALNLARYLYEKQLETISRAWHLVASRLKKPFDLPWCVAGQGSFVLRDLASRLEVPLATPLEQEVKALPARDVALLLAEAIKKEGLR